MTVLVVTAVFLAVYNNVAHISIWEKVWSRSYVVVNLAVAGLMLLLARQMLTASQLGLGEDSWLPGLAWGALTMVAGAAVLFVSQRVPAVAKTFEDRRYAELTDADAVRHALVRVPLGTALLEEVAFRGVLFALLEAAFSTWVAVIGTSVIFGIWHVGPVLRGLRANGSPPGTPGGWPGLVARTGPHHTRRARVWLTPGMERRYPRPLPAPLGCQCPRSAHRGATPATARHRESCPRRDLSGDRHPVAG